MHARYTCFLFFLAVSGSAATIPEACGQNAVDEGFLERYAATNRFRLGQPRSIQPTPDGSAVLFLRSGPRDFVQDLYELDLESGEERLILTSAQLLHGKVEELTAAEKARRERMRVTARGIASFELSPDGTRLLIPLSGELFLVERSTGAVRPLVSEAGSAIDARFSPDGKKVACVRERELYVIDLASGNESRLTSESGTTISNGLAEFVAQEEMSRYHGYWWSPDSRSILYQRTDTGNVELMHIADAAHPENMPDSWPYPRPGKPNAGVRLGIVPVEGGATTWIDWDRATYEYLATVKWIPDAPLTLLVQNRRQTQELLLAANPDDGSTQTLLVERDEAWLDIEQAMPLWLDGGTRFLWMTERNGAKQLEIHGRDGELLGALNSPEFGLQGFGHFSPDSGEIIVRASEDPTQSMLYRLSLDLRLPSAELLTPESGVHSVVTESDGPLFVYRRVDDAGQTSYEVAGRSGALGAQVRSTGEDPGSVPRLEFTTVGDDPVFRAVLIRPRSFDPLRRYPVIAHVYGGPGSQMVRRDSSKYLLDQWIADHGFVVVAVDGRGTPGRGRTWERSIKGSLIDAPLEDLVRALKLLGERYSELDLGRVGIYGWSFGGYLTAMAVLRHPDVFQVGVAGAPVVAWEDYDTHYTERYMDLPDANPEGYEAANILSYADQLSRPLLLVHGTADDNVYFAHSLKFANALFLSGRPFEFLPLSGFTHMVADPEVTVRLYIRFIDLFEKILKPGSSGRASRETSGE